MRLLWSLNVGCMQLHVYIDHFFLQVLVACLLWAQGKGICSLPNQHHKGSWWELPYIYIQLATLLSPPLSPFSFFATLLSSLPLVWPFLFLFILPPFLTLSSCFCPFFPSLTLSSFFLLPSSLQLEVARKPKASVNLTESTVTSPVVSPSASKLKVGEGRGGCGRKREEIKWDGGVKGREIALS